MTQKVGKVDTGRVLSEFKDHANRHDSSNSQHINHSHFQSGTRHQDYFQKYRHNQHSTLFDVYVKKFRKIQEIPQFVKESQYEKKGDKEVERFVTKNFSFLGFGFDSRQNQFQLQQIHSQII